MGNQYDEHPADRLLNKMADSSPEKMNAFTIAQRRKGDKWAVLADLLDGLITVEEADKQMGEIGATNET